MVNYVDIMNWIKRLFIKNDWQSIWATNGSWDIYTDFGVEKRKCVYEIQYSEIRNKYRLKLSGHNPKGHFMYREVVSLFNENYLKL